MSKNHKNNPYKKIYEDHYGKPPAGYHIHHIDGDPWNNDISNLVALSPEDHAEIHKNEFTKWATIGGQKGGMKCKEEKLGWFASTEEEWKERSAHARSHIRYELYSERIKAEYESGKRVPWQSLYPPEEVRMRISAGDPGKSTRGKKAWNNGIKMELSDPEGARKNKSDAAFARGKIKCDCCGKYFDPGNLVRHQNSKIQKSSSFHSTLTGEQKKEWHAAGGSKASRDRSSQYTYRITTDQDEIYIVNGLEFKQICKDKNWNYNTLHSSGGWGKRLLRGKHKGFMVEQLSVYDKSKS